MESRWRLNVWTLGLTSYPLLIELPPEVDFLIAQLRSGPFAGDWISNEMGPTGPLARHFALVEGTGEPVGAISKPNDPGQSFPYGFDVEPDHA